MKIFICTDLHGSSLSIKEIDRHLSKHTYDAVFMLGDICDRHDPNGLVYSNDFITLITKQYNLPLYTVHGNNEPDAVKLLFQQKGVSVHFNPRPLGDKEVIGVGWGDDFLTDPSFVKGKILLTHEPPRAAMLRKLSQQKQIANAPLIHVAGHLHKLAKVYHFGNTIFAHIPAAIDGKAAQLELPSRKISYITL